MGLWLDEFGLWRCEEDNKVSSSQADKAQIDSGTQTMAEGDVQIEEEVEEIQRTKKDPRWTLIPTPTESDLLAELGMQWLSPERRYILFCSFLK